MNIAGTEVSPKYHSFEVYVAGCTRRCPGCHNPETWDFSCGAPLDLEWMEKTSPKIMVGRSTGLIEHLWVLGGEPLDQPDLHRLLLYLSRFDLPIWLFTSYELEDVPKHIRRYCDYIKTGHYDRDTAGSYDWGMLTLSSANQQLHEREWDF